MNFAESKDPDNIEPYYIVWCAEDGTNDGTTSSDNGELQGATISSYTLAPTNITIDSDNTLAVTIKPKDNAPIVYPVNTVVTVWVSGGVEGSIAEVHCQIVTSDSRTLDKTLKIPIEEQ